MLITAVSGTACVTVPNTTVCTVPGQLSAGMNCAETLSDKTSELNFDQALDFLESGAICQSAADWGKQKTALELACRQLGNRCTYEVKAALKRLPQ